VTLQGILDKIANEPVVVTTIIGAVLSLLIVFGVPISDEQKLAILGVVTAVLALFARSQVTPV
jgi:hypothetical protein